MCPNTISQLIAQIYDALKDERRSQFPSSLTLQLRDHGKGQIPYLSISYLLRCREELGFPDLWILIRIFELFGDKNGGNITIVQSAQGLRVSPFCFQKVECSLLMVKSSLIIG